MTNYADKAICVLTKRLDHSVPDPDVSVGGGSEPLV